MIIHFLLWQMKLKMQFLLLKKKLKKKDNKLYIEIPPRFPKDKIEINLTNKETDVINYDELMKKTFNNIYKK